MAQPNAALPPGWQSQWDPTAGRNVYIETATGRTQWQPPTAGTPGPPPAASAFRPSHPQGAARMSMPPMPGPPGMRGMSSVGGLSSPPPPTMGPGAPVSPTPSAGPASPPASIGPGATSRRRAYPTAHLAANSISYSGGFDPGAQALAAGGAQYGGSAQAQGYGAQQGGPQLFTPGIPEAQEPLQQQQQQQARPLQPAYGQPPVNGSAAAGGGGYGGSFAAPAGASGMGGGVAAVTNQFQNMGMGAAGYGVARGNQLLTVNVAGVQPNVNEIERPPPEIRLPPNSSITNDPRANADPSYQRCTLNAVPTTSALLQKTRLPLGLILTPYRSVREEDGDEPVPVVTDTVIARCRRCRTYINPFVQFIEGGNRWKCCMCNISNEVPQLFDWDQEKNQPADRWKRPELNHSVVEFIAPREYMVRPPQPPVYVFLIDVSHQSMNNGMAATAARTILESLDRIPNDDGRTRVCIIAVDTALHFFSIPAGGSEAEMLVVSDVDDVFLPKPHDLMLNLSESRSGIETLLGRISDMFTGSLVVGSAMGAALQAAYKLISPTGGKIMCLTACLPSLGPGALKNRDDPKLLGTSKESSLLGAASTFYKTFPIDCSRAQVSVDMWLFASAYTDVATLSCLPRYTGGQTYFYPGFNASRSEDALKFSHEFAEVLASPICYEAVLRLRTSKGIRATQFHGNFFVRSTDLLALPAVPLDQNYAIECEIEEAITAPFVVFQAVVLHSTSFGERRIRVVNLAIPTTTNMSEVYASADQQAIAMLLANKAVERSIHHRLEDARDAVMNKIIDIFTTYKSTMTSAGSGASAQLSIASNMSLLPLLLLGLLKHVGIRHSTQIPPDLRAYAQALLTTLPTQLLLPYLHPNFYCLHNMPPEAGTWVTDAPPAVPADAEGKEDGKVAEPKRRFVFPAKLNLTSEKLERHGLYLIEDGQTIFLWVGRDAVPQLCSDVFDAPNYGALKGGKTTLPELDNTMNKRVRAIIERTRTMRRGPYRPHLYIAKEDGEPSVRMWALSMLIEDRDAGVGGMSYTQFLTKIRDKVNGGSS